MLPSSHAQRASSALISIVLLLGVAAVPLGAMGAAGYHGFHLSREFPNLTSDLDRAGLRGGGQTVRNQIANCMFGFRSYEAQKARCARLIANEAAGTGGPLHADRVASALNIINFVSN